MKKIYNYIKHTWSHKLSFWKIDNLKKLLIKYGPTFLIIFICIELLEHIGLPILFYWLGNNFHEMFYALVPTPLFICLHFLTAPIVFFIYITIIKQTKKPLSNFSKNILKLFGSISIAQAIPFIITPILTQFFSTEEFGIYGLYITSCSILGMIAAGKYDTAIMLPKSNLDAKNILALTFMLAFIFTTICFSILNIFQNSIFNSGEYLMLKNNYIIIPITVFLISINQSIIVWLNRKNQYNKIANYNIVKSSSNSLSALFLGLKNIQSGLIIGNLISLLLVTILNSLQAYKDFKHTKFNLQRIKKNFLYYIDFLKFSTISNLFNSLSNLGMTTIIIIFFGPKLAGLYFLAEKVVSTPISLITSSISQVYFEQASKLFHSDKKQLLKLTNTIQKNILYILFPFLFLLSLFSENLFGILGEQWREAGTILKYFTVLILAKNIYSPISHIGDILQEQRILLLFNISLFSFQLASFFALKNYNDMKTALFIASILGAFHYILLNIYMKKKLLNKHEKVN